MEGRAMSETGETGRRRGPILIEDEATGAGAREGAAKGSASAPSSGSSSGQALGGRLGPAPSPADVPPVPDEDDGPPAPSAVAQAARLATWKPSRLAGLFWSALGGLIVMMITVAAWDFVAGLLARNLWLGRAAMILAALVALILVLWLLREFAAMARLARIDRLQARARKAMTDRPEALTVTDALARLYAGRGELAWGLRDLAERRDEVLDADGLMALAERRLMQPLDVMAVAEVERAARQVATVTAVVPLALADVVTALVANTRMVRRIAVVYGGRAGLFGSWRLFRAVAAHLVATGAVAVGDDLISSVAGGGVLSKLSRRFGEGVVNGALTARVGIAAIEVCRPLPFSALPRPRVTALVRRALAGLFSG